MEISNLAQLTPESDEKVIEVKLYRKWTAKSIPQMTPSGLACILLDREGTAIQANMHRNDIDFFNDRLRVGSAYRISNFVCETTKGYQQTLENKTSLQFGRSTIFESIPPTGFPHHYFRFTPYNQLESRVPKVDANNKLQYPILTDYIGCIRGNGPVEPFVNASGVEGVLRKIQLENLSGKIIELTIWDKMAEQFEEETRHLEQPVIMAVSSCRVSKYTDYQLAASPATSYYLNPNLPQTQELRAVFKTRYEEVPPLVIYNTPYKDTDKEKLRNRYCLKTIIEQNPTTFKGVRFTAQATITDVKTDRDWFYESCLQCARTAIQKHGQYRCLTHGLQSGPAYRYKFKGHITDPTATIPMTFFSNAADKITGHSCKDLVQKYNQPDPKTLPPEVTAVQGKSAVFQFHLNTFANITDLSLDDVFDIQTTAMTGGSPTSDPPKDPQQPANPTAHEPKATQHAKEEQDAQSVQIDEANEPEPTMETLPKTPAPATESSNPKATDNTRKTNMTKRPLFPQPSSAAKKTKED